jgi:carbon-monoxide dehydrogenase small subunit
VKPIPEPTDRIEVAVSINGREESATVNVRKLLSDFIREDLGLTGTHVGCENGVCGSCTVIVDGQAVRSCTLLAVQAEGAEVTTVEGVSPARDLSRLQQAFTDHHALQCGFCTPGFLMTLEAAAVAPDADDAEIRELLSGNLCRCTGYDSIVAAVRAFWADEGV